MASDEPPAGEGRINSHKGKNYTKVTTGKFQSKCSDFILNPEDFNAYLDEKGYTY